MRSHRAGHYQPIEETLALLAITRPEPAFAFAGNDAAPVAVNATPTVLASVTLTPTRTGKFEVTGTAVATNGDAAAAHTFILAIGRVAPDYSQTTGINLMAQAGTPPSQNAYEQSDTILMEYGSAIVPFTFPVGVPATINLFGQASVGGEVFVNLHQAQLTVRELSS